MKAVRGDVWLIGFGEQLGREQAGSRPGVVVSAGGLNESSTGVVIVVPCTKTRRNLPSHVELDPKTTGLDGLSYAQCEDVKSISEERLIARFGVAGQEAMFEISRALRFLLDL